MTTRSQAQVPFHRLLRSMTLGLISHPKSFHRPAGLMVVNDSSGRRRDGADFQAVDGFDFARGNRFSTYATWAIRNVLARNDQRFIRRRAHHFALDEEPVATPDSGIEAYERQDFQDRRRAVIRRWLDRLDKRERRILTCRYGIGGTPELTLARIGLKLGLKSSGPPRNIEGSR